MRFPFNLKKIGKNRPCPNCGASVKLMNVPCPYCGYEPHIIYCPRCFTIVCSGTMRMREALLEGRSITGETPAICTCGIPYREANLTCKEYLNACAKIAVETVPEHTRCVEDRLLMSNLAAGQCHRQIFLGLEDKTSFDPKSVIFQSNFAFMFPYSNNGRAYFIEHYGADIDSVLRHSRKENLPVGNNPQCPVCGSYDMTKLSTIKSAAKIAAVGILGAGDLGKTWKCNRCGTKF